MQSAIDVSSPPLSCGQSQARITFTYSGRWRSLAFACPILAMSVRVMAAAAAAVVVVVVV